ncbi:hypothetical protein NEOLEDRAFT_1165089 [Neolentinus lepideus HHB14362 ss-1]|uniref:Uncharacterized protein n=1 Tax=Neolentinus lepideus HHB14362 ss-1 TaxID=1314782 RepID=A0A165NZW7_9AGAM|nr:hypothetical protein NEOLEDRAFT_1165089 [Neolentinus lepideus HHB14362 ss-1]
MGAFPRALFSEMELRVMRWFAIQNGVARLPTVKQTKRRRQNIMEITGIESTTVEGKLGHLYMVNDWRKIIEHEFANPLVRGKLHFYPEDSGYHLEDARQAERWRDEVDGNLACPMVRDRDGKDYFVEEPCLASIDGLGRIAPIMPMCWFTRGGRTWARVHLLRLTRYSDAFVIDGRPDSTLDIPLDVFFMSVLDLQDHDTQRRYGLPSPDRIAGVLHSEDPVPSVNRWRAVAAGKRVYSLPLWMYCDDTSRNVSKKWNKHNSILFTLAGLPRKYCQMLYNIHFIATSNIAAPLEMMEHIVNTLRAVRQGGIEEWDCVHQEQVLAVPWVLAFQGDNPMSSEFAAHIGMTGKCFCHICDVRGADEKNHAPEDAGAIEQVSEFLKEQTREALSVQLDRILEGAPSAHFVKKLAAECAKIKEDLHSQPLESTAKTDELKRKMKEFRGTLPENLFNPCLDIPDFDPNQDSPVEILHVVLLGVVKYWWRDAVSHQTSQGKEELKTQLSSADVAGLNTARLRGHTLPAIDDLPSYLDILQSAIDDFLIATALWMTQWFNKPKFHLFSYNLVIQLRTRAFAHLHAVRHLISGGFLCRDPWQAGADNEFREFMCMEAVEWPERAGHYTALSENSLVPWRSTLTSSHHVAHGLVPSTVLRCRKLVLSNGDTLEVNKYTFYRTGIPEPPMVPNIGLVREILVDPDQQILIGVLVAKCEIGTYIEPYEFPSCRVSPNDLVLVTFNADSRSREEVIEQAVQNRKKWNVAEAQRKKKTKVPAKGTKRRADETGKHQTSKRV